MFKPIPVNLKGVVAFKAVGKLTHDDYQKLLPTLEKIIAEEGRVSLLLELENFHGWNMEAARDDYQFASHHRHSFERIAIVGDRRWEKWLTRLASPFIDGQVRYFTHDQLPQAWDWVREPSSQAARQTETVQPWRNILVPVDFSSHSERAVQRAAMLARESNATLTLLHVVEDFLLYDDFYNPVMPVQIGYEETLMDAASERLTQWAKEMKLDSAQIEVLPGSASNSILTYAEAQEVDLIVMGSHGRKGIAKLLGSTTNSVLNHARCEVLSVPLTG